jgi:hypothetical protein
MAATTKRKDREPASAATLPHSWPSSRWLPDVYPNTTEKARYLIRTHKRELIECGALVRIGRELVVIGAAYAKWLNRHGVQVPGYEIAPNRAREEVPAE